MNVERSFRDNGTDAEWAMVGGARIRISDAVRALPEIFQNGDEFFYKDGSPVTDVKHISYLPEPYKSQAVKFIAGDKVAPAQVFTNVVEAQTVAATPKRGRGRPKKLEGGKKIEIKDEASLSAAERGLLN